MDRRTTSRVLSGVIIALLVAVALYNLEAGYNAMGKERFLAHEAARYDASYKSPSGLTLTAIVSFFLAFGVFGAYEVLALGIYALLNRRSAQSPS